MKTKLTTEKIISSFNHAAKSYDAAAVVQREIGNRMLSRLELIRLQPTTILDLGCGTGYFSNALAKRYPDSQIIPIDLAFNMVQFTKQTTQQPCICANAQSLPLADNTVDIIFSNLVLHWCADVVALLKELRRVLRPDGVLLFSTLGPDTLYELRQSWAKIDDGTHVYDFADMHDIGDALLAANFAEPVMDRENIIVSYQTVQQLMRDLKGIGAHNLAQDRHRGLTGKNRLKQLEQAYRAFQYEDGKFPASYEVVYGQAWSPNTEVRIAVEDISLCTG